MDSLRPTIVIDTREQTPLEFKTLPTIRGTLTSGDYSFVGAEEDFSIERKTVSDIVGCCVAGRERFERELLRLRGYKFKRLFIIGTEEDVIQQRYHGRILPKAVLHSLCAWTVRYEIPVEWFDSPEKAAWAVERYVWWFAREIVTKAKPLMPATKGRRTTAAVVAPAVPAPTASIATGKLKP